MKGRGSGVRRGICRILRVLRGLGGSGLALGLNYVSNKWLLGFVRFVWADFEGDNFLGEFRGANLCFTSENQLYLFV